MPIHFAALQRQSLQLEQYVKKHIVSFGTARVRGPRGMIARQGYLLRAAELSAKAQAEHDHARKIEFQNLARMRPAEQAERNSHTDFIYETPPKKDGHQAYGPAARASDADKE